MNEMKMRNEQVTLENVLDAYVSANPAPSEKALIEWIRRYPQYRQQLIDFTISWIQLRHLPPSTEPDEIDEMELVEQGMTVVRNLLTQRREQNLADQRDQEREITSLLDAGKRLGLSPSEVTKKCRFGIATMRKLDRRLISLVSIPLEAVAIIAKTIGHDPKVVLRYLGGSPTFARGMQYRAEQRPTMGEKQDFFEAIRSDSSMSEEDRDYWLRLEANGAEK